VTLKKKTIYDQYGEDGLKAGAGQGPQGSPFEGFTGFTAGDPFKIFEQFTRAQRGGKGGFSSFNNMDEEFGFGGGQSFGGSPFGFSFGGSSPFGSQSQSQNTGFGHSGFGSEKRKAETQERELKCTLEELFKGIITIERVVRTFYSDSGQRQQQEKYLEVEIKPGWKNGTKITFHGEGDQPSPNVSPADLCFKIVQIPHPHYSRDGHDLIYLARITLAQALTGIKLKVPDLTGKNHEIVIRDVISPSFEYRIRGAGMPKPKTPDQLGDLIVRFTIQFPVHIKDTDKPALKRILSGTS